MSPSIQGSSMTSGLFEKLSDDVISKIYNQCDIKTWERLRSTNHKMKVMSERYISNTMLASSIVFHHPHLYKHLRDTSIAVLECDSVAASAVSSSPASLLKSDFLPDSLKNDAELKKNAFVSAKLEEERQEIDKTQHPLLTLIRSVWTTLTRKEFPSEKLSDKLLQDKDISAFAKNFNQDRTGPAFLIELRALQSYALHLVTTNGLELKNIDPKLLVNHEIILAAVRQNGLALEFAHFAQQDNIDIVIEAVTQNGLALQFASERLKNCTKIVLAAVHQNPKAFDFAGKQINFIKSLI